MCLRCGAFFSVHVSHMQMRQNVNNYDVVPKCRDLEHSLALKSSNPCFPLIPFGQCTVQAKQLH